MSEKKRILIVDDEVNIRRILQVAFEKAGYTAVVAEDGQQALIILETQQIDCVLTDVTMPRMTGYELQNAIQSRWSQIPVIIMTAFGTIPQAVAAIRNGAFEFVTKPFDLEALKKVVKAAINQGSQKVAKRNADKKTIKTNFIAVSPVMQEIRQTIDQVADSRATVLITGESGTGKEVVANLIHELSPRSAQAFVGFSCAALPETLLESELFGYEKGAFTGADISKPGRFELAHEGTLFLDEIGEVPLSVQAKLLRVLQEREFERLGATKPTKVEVRLVAATNRDLQQEVEAGNFRLDLLYRLQVIEIWLPPLRDREEDIEPLTRHLLGKYNAENDRSLDEIEPAALAALRSYPWPGNIRELGNVIERACVLAKRSENALTLSHLPPHFRSIAA